jgi:hypothetical protein
MTSHLKPLAPPPPPPPPRRSAPPPGSASATASVSGAPASGAAASAAALASSASAGSEQQTGFSAGSAGSARFVRFGAEGRGASAEGWREKAASKAALDLRARIPPEPSARESATSSAPACAGGGGAEAGGKVCSLFTATRGSTASGSSAGPTSPRFRGGGGLGAALLRTLRTRRVRPGRICTLQIPAWFQLSGHLRRAGGCH